MDDEMVKARTSSTNKLHFVIPHAGKVFKIRAGCLIIRDFDGNCLMTKEPRLSKNGNTVIGFCGGTVEEIDRNIIDTVLREAYEECILSDIIPTSWRSDWTEIYSRIVHAPKTLDEIIFNHIYTMCRNRQMVYVDGNNVELRGMYFQVNLPKLYSDYLVSKYDMQVVSAQMFDVMSEIRETQSVRYCLRFGIPSYQVGKLHFRLREIMIATPKFSKFLQYGLSKIGSEPRYNTVLEIAKASPWYKFCKTGQELITKTANLDPIIRDTCILISIILSKHEWQEVYDLWYHNNAIDHGMAVINLMNHFLHGSLVTPDLEKKRDEIRAIIQPSNSNQVRDSPEIHHQ